MKSANKLVAEYEKTQEVQKQRPQQTTTPIKSNYSPYPYVPTIFDEALYKWRSSTGFFEDYPKPTITESDNEDDEDAEFSEMSEKLFSRMRDLDESLEYASNPDTDYEVQ